MFGDLLDWFGSRAQERREAPRRKRGSEKSGNEKSRDQSWRLILPATYVISPAGRVVYAQAHADFRVRPEPEEALAASLAAVRP